MLYETADKKFNAVRFSASKRDITLGIEMHYPIDSVLKIYYSILGAIGIPVNLVAILVLSRGKCGLSPCTTRYLLAMAMADLLFIITEVILWRIAYYYFPSSFFLITPVCSVIYALRCASMDCSVWFTVNFTFDRFVAVCCQGLRAKYCTERTAAVVLATTELSTSPGESLPQIWRCEQGREETYLKRGGSGGLLLDPLGALLRLAE
ncbi:probable G-protein coupled receptor 139 [Stegostoma tigrinum]|uniref:probable G-protein coupled receptor 139 n=1 Tax=Stegostoma tigrinum TaxID=3053191 RepID=UPI0028709BC1|nr:probable G-protein coupled receptor 139 [Stegostoma tigrinum]